MAKIGNFKMVSGELRGQIVTLALQAKSVRIVTEDMRTFAVRLRHAITDQSKTKMT